MRKTQGLPGSTLVHCHAGVGRTGAYAAAVLGLDKLTKGKRLNLKQLLVHLRSQRCGAVQEPVQYAFATLLLLHIYSKDNDEFERKNRHAIKRFERDYRHKFE